MYDEADLFLFTLEASSYSHMIMLSINSLHVKTDASVKT